MPLFLPSTRLGNPPTAVTVHLVFISIPRNKFPRFDGPIADCLVETTGRHWTGDLVHHRDIGSGGNRAVISDPDARFGGRTGIRRAAADLVFEAGDDELGSGPGCEGDRDALAVVAFVCFRLRSLVVNKERQGAGPDHVRHLDRRERFFPRTGARGEGTGQCAIVSEERRRSPIAGNRVRATDVSRSIDRTLVGDPGTETDEVARIGGSLEESEAADGEVDVRDIDRSFDDFEHGLSRAVIAFMLLRVLATVIVVVLGMVDTTDDIVDTWCSDPLPDESILGLGVGIAWFQVTTLSCRTVEPPPGPISRVGVLLVAPGEVAVAGDGGWLFILTRT